MKSFLPWIGIVLVADGVLLMTPGCTDSGVSIPELIFPGISVDGTDVDVTVSPVVSKIYFRDFTFDPLTISVSEGSTVQWVNDETSSTNHAITFEVPGPIVGEGTQTSITVDSGILEPGDTFDWTFTSSGTYQYFCYLHPGSPQGTVVVR